MSRPHRHAQDTTISADGRQRTAERGGLRTASAGLAVIAITGLAFSLRLRGADIALPQANNFFFRFFANSEPWPLAFLALFGIWAAWQASQPSTTEVRAWGVTSIWPLTLGVLVAASLVWAFALHETPLSMDEFNAVFQATLLASGRIFGDIPPDLRGIAPAITPVFVAHVDHGTRWVSAYPPGYALLRVPFQALGVGWLLNPLLGAATVVLVHRVASALWPDERRWAWTAAALLGVSPQLIVTSATAYAMPAHLALNLAWFALYLRRTPGAAVMLGPVGALALSLHNPFPHALFVTPFLFRLLGAKRWGTLAYLGACYGATSLAVLGWLRLIHPLTHAGGGGLSILFGAPGMYQYYTFIASSLLILSWQTPASALGWFVIARSWRALPTPLRDAALGVVLTMLFYIFFRSDQGHGWGYRYAYPILGNLVLLAVAGLRHLSLDTNDGASTDRVIMASLAFSLVVQVPVRLVQVESTVRPFAEANEFLARLRADVVVVPTEALWYGRDLIRNDPLLQRRPTLAGTPPLSAESIDSLTRVANLRVRVVTIDELTALGMERVEQPR